MTRDAGAGDASTPARSRSGSAVRKRFHAMSFRLSDTEHRLIKLEAERAGQTVGSYVRARVLAQPSTRAVRRPSVELTELARLLATLGKCGGNLNQIARALNSGGDRPLDLEAELAGFRAACADIMRVMGRPPRGGGAP